MPERPDKGPLDQFEPPATIAVNDFKFKSLSNWSYNISFGCVHGCSFCYVPDTAAIKQEKNFEKLGFMRAEGVGFEPTVPFTVRSISSRVPSTGLSHPSSIGLQRRIRTMFAPLS